MEREIRATSRLKIKMNEEKQNNMGVDHATTHFEQP